MSNVVRFPLKEKNTAEPTYHLEMQIELDSQGNFLRVWGREYSGLPLPSHIDFFSARAMWAAAWCCWADYAKEFPDDPEAVTLIAAVSRGSRVTVYSPPEDSDDAYVGEARLAWLKRRLNEIHDLAQPSWSEELPASGMTSSSHSANIDQLSFSW